MGTEVALSDFIPYNSWTTIRMEIDASELLLDLYIGGVLVEEDLAITDASVLAGTTISMQAFGVAYTHSPGVGWSNLKVYEGTL